MSRVDELFRQLLAGANFWTVVQDRFKSRDLSGQELAGLIDRGLRETSGGYRQMLRLFHLPESDYKRFHWFLYQAGCNLPVHPYRRGKVVSRKKYVERTLRSR